MKRALLLLVVAGAGFAQSRVRMAEYALVLEDAPVAQKAQSRMALRSNESQAHLQKIRTAQSGVIAELQRRKMPGVKYVLPAPHAKPALDRAVSLMNVPKAWDALGGAGQAGAGIRIG